MKDEVDAILGDPAPAHQLVPFDGVEARHARGVPARRAQHERHQPFLQQTVTPTQPARVRRFLPQRLVIERLEAVERDDRRHAASGSGCNRAPAGIAMEHDDVAFDAVLTHPALHDERVDERRQTSGGTARRREVVRRHDRHEVPAARKLVRQVLIRQQDRGLLVPRGLEDDGDLFGDQMGPAGSVGDQQPRRPLDLVV